jgi:hypothetical protein
VRTAWQIAAMPRPNDLAPVGGDDDQRRALHDGRIDLARDEPLAPVPCQHVEQRIDPGVAGHEHARRIHALAQQVCARALGRCEQQVGEHVGESAVLLLGKRRGRIARSEAGLDVRDGHARVERRERGGEGAGGVALHDHDVRTQGGESAVERREQPRGEIAEPLIRPHHVQIDVGHDAERIEHLPEHLAVLRGGDDHRLQAVGVRATGEDDRRHLDRVRSRADDERDARAAHAIAHCEEAGGAMRPRYRRPPRPSTPRDRARRRIAC